MKKLLIVVDYQVDFVSGALGFEGAELIGPVIKEKIESYLKENNDVIFLKNGAKKFTKRVIVISLNILSGGKNQIVVIYINFIGIVPV